MYQLISIGNMYFKERQDIYPVWVLDDMPGALDDAFKSRSTEQTSQLLKELGGLPIKVTTVYEEA